MKKEERRVDCGYCGRQAKLVNGSKIYPHRPDLVAKHFWNCDPCGAYVGCHPGTTNPLGRLANAELRSAKQAVHRVLDPLWKSGQMTRTEAYKMLAGELGISAANCHVGMFNVETCKAAVAALSRVTQRKPKAARRTRRRSV